MDAAIKIKNVSVGFGRDFKALDDVSIDLPQGKIIGFIGPSGAGKTTLIRCIVGRQKVQTGSVMVLGLPAGSAQLRARISYMTQEISVYPDLTVAQNLQYFATMYGIKRREARQLIPSILTMVDMTAQAGQLVNSLSGGQKQRVSLAVALIGSPKVMVLDEPTVGLDPVLREQIWRMFHQLAIKGTTIIVSSHVMDEAERCDDLVLIRGGKVLAHDTPQSLCDATGEKTVEQSFLKLVGESA